MTGSSNNTKQSKSLVAPDQRTRELGTPANLEHLAAILEREREVTISHWLERANREPELTGVPLSDYPRTGHFPMLLEELIHRLRFPRSLGARQVSNAAVLHGKIRESQRYSVSMLVEESRIFRVSIFETLHSNLNTVDFSLSLLDVMTIADEVDSQLKQIISSFVQSAGKPPAASAA